MNRYILAIALSFTVFLRYPALSMAFYTRGTLTREISYDRLAVTPLSPKAETYKPFASGTLVNNTRNNIVISAELSFCNVFGESLGTVTVRCTIPPMKKKPFKKRIKGEASVDIKDAHHVEWTVLRLKKG